MCTHLGSLALLQKQQQKQYHQPERNEEEEEVRESSSKTKLTLSHNNIKKQQHPNKYIIDSHCGAMFIVVCPATVLYHWLQEMHRWAPFLRAVVLHSISSTACELLQQVGDAGKCGVMHHNKFASYIITNCYCYLHCFTIKLHLLPMYRPFLCTIMLILLSLH